jgi:hypothetical protein
MEREKRMTVFCLSKKQISPSTLFAAGSKGDDWVPISEIPIFEESQRVQMVDPTRVASF